VEDEKLVVVFSPGMVSSPGAFITNMKQHLIICATQRPKWSELSPVHY